MRGVDLPALIGDMRPVLGGDVILAIEEQKACHRECILHELRDRAEASSVTLTLWREGREIRMEIPVERRRILGRSASSRE